MMGSGERAGNPRINSTSFCCLKGSVFAFGSSVTDFTRLARPANRT